MDDLERYRGRRAAIDARHPEDLAAIAARPISAGKPAIEGESAVVSMMVGESRPEWHRGSVSGELLADRGIAVTEVEGER